MWKSGEESGVGNIGKDVRNVTFDRVIGGRGFRKTWSPALGKTGVVNRGGERIGGGYASDIST